MRRRGHVRAQTSKNIKDHQLMVRGRKEVTKAAPARPEIHYLIDQQCSGCQERSGNKASGRRQTGKDAAGHELIRGSRPRDASPSEAGFEKIRRSAGAGLKQPGGRDDSRSSTQSRRAVEQSTARPRLWRDPERRGGSGPPQECRRGRLPGPALGLSAEWAAPPPPERAAQRPGPVEHAQWRHQGSCAVGPMRAGNQTPGTAATLPPPGSLLSALQRPAQAPSRVTPAARALRAPAAHVQKSTMRTPIPGTRRPQRPRARRLRAACKAPMTMRCPQPACEKKRGAMRMHHFQIRASSTTCVRAHACLVRVCVCAAFLNAVSLRVRVHACACDILDPGQSASSPDRETASRCRGPPAQEPAASESAPPASMLASGSAPHSR